MSAEESDAVICRACIEECVEYKNIYRQGIILGDLTTLAAMLSYCTHLEFQEDEDFLPSNMCNSCVQNLAKFYVFKQTVERANNILRNQHVELESNPTEVQEWEDVRTDDNIHHKKQEDIGQEDSYVTLTVVESDAETYEMKTEQESQEDLDCKEEEIIYDDGDTEESNHFRDEDYNTEYEISYHEDESSVVEQSTSVPEEIENEDTGKITPYKMISQPMYREIRPRATKSGVKPVNPDLQCQFCGKQLSNSNSFRYHLQLHSDATPYLCSECGTGFKTRNAYEGHMSIHDPNNPNRCELCGKTYRQPSSLRSHMLTHTGEKPFQCGICGKGMTQKSGYKKHMLTHTGEKPHSCDICGRDFRYSSNLIAHKRYHTGEKPFDCPLCEKCFPTSEQLKRHTLVHTGERPFSCELCDKRFNRRSVLTSHRLTHMKMEKDDQLLRDQHEVLGK